MIPSATASPPRVERGIRSPQLVGILNVTPDSFYDGGLYMDPPRAVRRGLDLFAAGASWVDVGGMSTRPGSEQIPAKMEMDRVVPVIAQLSADLADHPSGSGLSNHAQTSGVPYSRRIVSIDTCRAKVAESALAAGASCINDVSGFGVDPAMCEFAASADCPVVINHMKGTPLTMQVSPSYVDLWDEILRFFEIRMDRFSKAKGRESNVILDPGIGFGKTLEHNMEILRGIDLLRRLGRPIFLGCSRKSFIRHLAAEPSSGFPQLQPPSAADRLPGSLAAAAWAASRRVDFLRVHDVAETAQFLKVFLAIAHE